MPYNHKEIEKKWQERWEKDSVFQAKDFSKAEKFYCLVEFPYPSGSGLHVGHVRSYASLDVIARKRRMEGFNVLYPIGWDAFGLPTENFAIKTGRPPREVTKENTDTFRRQLKSLGISFDWSREINTTDPEYYKWTQWQFLQFFKAGLAYKDKKPINWCLDCKTGLANEEVVDRVCERCGGKVEKREKEQWMIAITKYADRLLDDLEDVDYLSKIKKQQQDWIGKSEGAEIVFELADGLSEYNFLGLHAFKDSSKDAFWPWLKKELKVRGAKLTVLDLPNPATPNIDEQVAYIQDNYNFNEKTVVVTHSLGGVAAMKLLPRLDKKIHKLIMCAPPLRVEFLDGKKRPALKNACDWKFAFDEIKAKADQIVVMIDENDPIVPLDQPTEIADRLGATVRKVEAADGHFNGKKELNILNQLFPSINVFTTRPDTIFGATYMVLAPEHELVDEITTKAQSSDVKKYVKEAMEKSEFERGDVEKEKTGVFTGAYAINPATDEQIPIWVADYVLMGYGTGAIMAVPEHDKRDREFAEKYKLPIVDEPLVPFDDAIKKVGGKKAINFKLRDWVFSRQRYWGEPIPLVHCKSGCSPNTGGWVAVPDKDLPVALPEVKKYEPTESGESPLAAVSDWVNTTCPECGGSAKRETDTMPNWAGSSWYFLRYTDPNNNESFADMKKLKYWMPVDLYNGGMEHTTLHLLYSRFWNKFLYDQGHVPTSEPYKRRHSHGLVLAEDGSKMSKSKGNIVSPDEMVEQYGADSLRLYEMFMGPFEEPVPWSTNGLVGVRRFLEKVWKVQEKILDTESKEVTRMAHKTIKKVSEDIEDMRFNTAISQMMTCVNEFTSAESVTKESFSKFLAILSPFAPHVTSELWEQTGNKGEVTTEPWPDYDKALVKDDIVTVAVQVNGKLRATIEISPDASEKEAQEPALAEENVQKYIAENKIKKVIYVPGRMINFVV